MKRKNKMNDKSILEIDGSMGEGGGAILRLSAGLSVVFNQPIRVYNIRANRSKPGLRLQHLLGLKNLAKLTNSSLSECEVGTKEIIFKPTATSLKEKLDIGVSTAASIGLLLQPIQIACLGFEHPDQVIINLHGGGTLGKWAPGLNYLKNVTYQIFKKHGFEITIDIHKYGFYPKGGGATTCKIEPPKKGLNPINLTSLGNLDVIEGKIVCSNKLSNARVSERIKESAEAALKREISISTHIEYEYVNSLSVGVGISLWAKSDTGAIISSGTVLGERHISSEQLGRNAVNKILAYIQNDIPVDNYLSDQLLPFMAFTNSASKIKVAEVTSHARTNLELIKMFAHRDFAIENSENYSIIKIN